MQLKAEGDVEDARPCMGNTNTEVHEDHAMHGSASAAPHAVDAA